MFGFLLALTTPMVLFFVVRAVEERFTLGRVFKILALAYFTRVVICLFLQEIPFFSYGSGGDCDQYEYVAGIVADHWHRQGSWEFITPDHPFLFVGNAALPINIFATIIWFQGGYTRIGCTAIVALAACLACYNLYRMALELGADREVCIRIMAVQLFAPGYLFYTSDMYKDSLVMLFAMASVTTAVRLTRKVTLLQLLLGISALICTWYTRYYMVYLSMTPFLVGLLGLNSKSKLRPWIVGTGLMVVGGAIFASSNFFRDAATLGVDTFNHATDDATRGWNRGFQTGNVTSGVTFDDDGEVFGSFGAKILYTLFSPFPWNSGSIGLQIGKVDTLIWYYFCFRAIQAGRRLWVEDKGLVLTFLTFIVPTTIAYAATMSNMGLILRQRLPVVLFATVLASLKWRIGREMAPVPEPVVVRRRPPPTQVATVKRPPPLAPPEPG